MMLEKMILAEAEKLVNEQVLEIQKIAHKAALMKQEREKELRKLELELAQIQSQRESANRDAGRHAKAPKLPTFVDGRDELDYYLLRFERLALANNGARAECVVSVHCSLGEPLKYTRDYPKRMPWTTTD